ncbi:MAG: HAD family hydrolase [Actinomycetes bacterium]
MTSAVAAVTVDLDDTLYPQQAWLAGAWDAVARRGAQLGLDRTALHEALVKTCAEGSDRGRIIDRALESLGAAPTDHLPDLIATFAAHSPRRLVPYPGVVAALRALADAMPVVCVTDGMPDVQRAKVAALGLGHLLTGVVVSDELGGRAVRKPHPAAFLHALELLGGEPARTVHIGDRPDKDVAGAVAAGMRCIRVLTGEYAGAVDRHPPWRTVPSFAAAAAACLGDAMELPFREQADPLTRL